jgi:energy-coupling factor transporter transmembrane protein EcfT
VPRLLTEQILLTWRFIFILLDEAMAIHRAQTLRFGYRSVPQGYRSLAMLVGCCLPACCCATRDEHHAGYQTLSG